VPFKHRAAVSGPQFFQALKPALPIADIFVLSLYTIGTTALLLPPPDPQGPAAMAGGSAHIS